MTPFDLTTFKRVADANWLRYKTIDGVVIGVLLATWNANFGNYAANKRELRRLLDASDAGKIGKAYVQTSKYDSKLEDEEIVEARWLWERLQDVKPREGQLGQFWSLPSLSGDDPM